MSKFRIVTRHNGEIVVERHNPACWVAGMSGAYMSPESWSAEQDLFVAYGAKETITEVKNWRGVVVSKTSVVDRNTEISSEWREIVFKSKAEAKRYIDDQLKHSKEAKSIEEYP